jgi:uncharacterized protein (DUF1501 family)
MAQSLSRREFLVGCCSAIAALAGSRITNLAFRDPEVPTILGGEILLVIFLRGGWDALNVVLPIAGADRGYYEASRPNLAIPVSGAGAAIALNAQFGLNPAMISLAGLYQAKKLAIVHAAGLMVDTRSHFDAQNFIELGTPGINVASSGWIARHLQTSPNVPAAALLPALSAGGSQALSLLGETKAVSMSSPSGFKLYGNWQFIDAQRAALRDLYNGADWLTQAGTETLDMIDLIERTNPGSYHPANGAVYPNGSFGNNLQAVAQLIKMQVGLQAATIDLGGWDTHEYQGDKGAGYMGDNLLKPLAQGLAAFYTDLDGACGANYNRRTTAVVMSEFGRRLKENANHGTDHGHGNVMLVLGGNVKGGKVYGAWPGLANNQLYDGADLAVTTDYRRVLSEILTRRLGNPNITTVFPGYTGYAPLDIVVDSHATPVPPPPNQTRRVYLPVESTNPLCP